MHRTAFSDTSTVLRVILEYTSIEYLYDSASADLVDACPQAVSHLRQGNKSKGPFSVNMGRNRFKGIPYHLWAES